MVLVTGAFGQIGTELTAALRARHGPANVLATGHHPPNESWTHGASVGPTALLDVTHAAAVTDAVTRHDIDTIYHLAAILSAHGEHEPQKTWHVNMDGLLNVLEAARKKEGCRVFWPSSIAAFGPETPRDLTPQHTVMRPKTIYGVSKVAGELLCDYYVDRYGLDVRGVRYPGVISSGSAPGGGTTDYAVEMFYAALQEGHYTAFVREDCVLPMLYMPDCIRAAITLMDAAASDLTCRNGYNIASMSFTAGELAAAIRHHIPEFVCEFVPDERQAIADSWPRSLDDSPARSDWGWQPQYDLAETTADMLEKLRARLNIT
ncbi:MAG: NAD-dependent epimerase/dehydratase family protein [Gammaproteobacteria bacterium]|jgi:nucleoside-diphosphate-sugar epimerase